MHGTTVKKKEKRKKKGQKKENFCVYVSKFLSLSVLLKVVLSLQAGLVLFLGNSYNEYNLKLCDTYKF